MKKIITFIFTLFLLFNTTQLSLAGKQPIGNISGEGNLNPNLTNPNAKVVVTNTFNRLISTVIGLLTIIAALYFLFQIIFAGYTILSSHGDTGKLSEGRERITFGVLGLTLVIGSYMILALISGLLGIQYIYNPLSNRNLFF